MPASTTHPCLSIVLPRYHEEEPVILASLAKIDAFAQQWGEVIEVVLVNDAGSDLVLADEITARLCVTVLHNETNSGKGYSVRRGVLHSTGEYIAYTDVDLPVELDALHPALCALQLGQADVFVGSRYHNGALEQWQGKPGRTFFSRLFRLVVKGLIPGIPPDPLCPFKVFRQPAVSAVFERLHLDGFAFDIEVLIIVRKLGFRVKTLPVHWHDIRAHLSFRKLVSRHAAMLYDAVRISRYWKHQA